MFGLPEYLLVTSLSGLPQAHGVARRVEVQLDGTALARLLEVGAQTGELAEVGAWADKAVEELSLLLEGADPWWRACCACAEAASRLDEIAAQALHGPVLFDLTPPKG